MKILETEDVGTCRKRLTVEVPPEEMAGELNDVYAEFLRSADVPGFRRGRAPRYVLQMRYGRVLEKEALRQAAEEAFRKATEEAGLRTVTDPEFTDLDKLTYKENEAITFSAEVECIPEFELADYTGLQPQTEEIQVTEKEVVEAIESFRKNAAYYRSVDRPVQDWDFVTCSVDATMEGQPFPEATHPEIIIEVGSKRYIPGFAEGLLGGVVGESREMDLVLPDSYPVEEHRGKTAHFSVTVKEIKVENLPELDDEFAKDMGDFNTMAELKDHVQRGLEQSLDARSDQALRESIRRQLLDANVFDPPPSMVRARFNYIQSVQDMDLRRMGSSLDEARKMDQGIEDRNRVRAEEETRLTLILDKIAKRENLEVSDEEYQAYIAGLARREDQDPAVYLRRIEEHDLQVYYQRLALEEKVTNFLLLPPEDRTVSPAIQAEDQTSLAEDEEKDSGTGTDGGGADHSG